MIKLLRRRKLGVRGSLNWGNGRGHDCKIWNGERYYSSDIHVSPSNLKTLEDLRLLLGDIPNISLKTVGDSVVIQGTNISLEHKERIDNYAAMFKTLLI